MQGIRESSSSNLEHVTLRVSVLGQFRLERRSEQGWQPVTDAAWQHQQVRMLLGCLLSSPGRKVGRKLVAEALWPDVDGETTSTRLNRAVHSLRQLLEPARGRHASSQLLRNEGELLALADQAQVWVDADAFDELFTEAQATNDPEQTELLLEQALALYGGDFLPEERQAEWAIARRQVLQRNWVGLLLGLADLRIAREAQALALEPLDRLLSVDPANEAVVQRLMIVLARLQRRGEALRAYHRLAAVLQQTYQIAPSLETRNLYEAVRRGEDALVISTLAPSINQQQTEVPTSRLPVPIGRSHQSPLIGRDQELGVLRRFLLASEQSTLSKSAASKRTLNSSKALTPSLELQQISPFMLLLGEAGMGKTRLAEEVSREVQQRGWAVVWSRIYAQEGNVPYRLWTEVLRNALVQDLWQQQVVSKHPLFYYPLRGLLPELHDLLPQTVFSSPLPPEQEQARLWEATAELLKGISESSPLLIVMDDLQWADNSSGELLGYLARHLHNHPVVLLGTCREPELPAAHPLQTLIGHLQREHAIETLHVHPLTDAQIAVLLSHLPQSMVQQIQTQAAGNPFFAEELAHSFSSAPSSISGEKQQETRNRSTSLPGTITAALDHRIGRLSSPCRQMLSNTAVLGGSFEFHTVRLMETNTIGEDTLLDLLEEALQAGVLTEEGSGTRITYHFWHPLLVSHLYEGVSAARRTRLHRRAAQVLRQVYQGREGEGAATITNHLLKGDAEPQQIARYAELAGDHAYLLSAYPEAEEHYRLAVAHLETYASALDERLHLAYLLERLGECLMIRGKFAEARHTYEQTLKERSQQYTFASQVESQYEAQLQALLWGEIGWTWRYEGNALEARRCIERGAQVLQKAEVLAGPARARLRFQQGSLYWQEGNFDEARRAAREALTLFEETLQQEKKPVDSISLLTRMRRTLIGDPVDVGRTHLLLGSIANSAGQPTESLTHLNIALAMFEEHRRERETAHVCCNIGHVHLKKAEHPLADSYLNRALSLAERLGDIPLMSVVFSNLGELAARSGELAKAEIWYRQALTLIERINDREYLSMWHASLATVLQDQGKFTEAGTCLRRALSIGRAIHNAPCIGFALVAVGNLRILQTRVASGSGARDAEDGIHFLVRARATLARALAFKELEAETRTLGDLALAETSLLLGDSYTAVQEALYALEEAQRYELIWLIARCQGLLASALVADGKQERAEHYLAQAIEVQHRCGMRLEYARTLHCYGTVLLEHLSGVEKTSRQAGLSYLREARQIFSECGAVPDLQIVERALARFSPL